MFYQLALWVALDRSFPMWVRERAILYIARKDAERKSFPIFPTLLRERYPALRKYPRVKMLRLIRKDGKPLR